ncbi:hypothetical protein PAP_06010 [Palaeococcus pacificus DY20341]|uniref:KaiC domain-containing protein n=1 Tax=Palaeococcus pacificus DY20341 TaxID=1343739 RepID=A0A075LUF3_9EURY|nr:hypothetical protein PAP_06010 [Palaeococcus pacificus DY20341]
MNHLVREVPRINTGIIDELIEGGIPIGSIILIKGNPKSGKSLFINQILYNQLRQGVPIIGILADEPKEEFLQNTREFGWDFLRYGDKVRLVDIFSKRIRKKSVWEEDPIITNPYDILEFMSIIKDITLEFILKQDQPYIAGWVSSINSLFFGMEKSLVYEFFNNLKDLAKRAKQVWFVEMNSNTEVPDVEAAINAIADGIIELKLTEEDKTLERYLRVYGMRRTIHSSTWVPFEITKRGIVLKN